MCNHLDSIPACDRRMDRQTDRWTSCDGIVHAVHTHRVIKSYPLYRNLCSLSDLVCIQGHSGSSYEMRRKFSRKYIKKKKWYAFVKLTVGKLFCGWVIIFRNRMMYHTFFLLQINFFIVCLVLSSSSRMRVIYHNWSAMKQRPHPQSVAEISHHSVLVLWWNLTRSSAVAERPRNVSFC